MLAQEPHNIEKHLKQLSIIEEILTQVIAENPCTTLKDLAISGKDLTSIGIPKGEIIGELLNNLLEDVITEKVENNKETLLAEAKKRLI
jgi:tRNA nucleotidyltransferase (CCA-adding enzyme)